MRFQFVFHSVRQSLHWCNLVYILAYYLKILLLTDISLKIQNICLIGSLFIYPVFRCSVVFAPVESLSLILVKFTSL